MIKILLNKILVHFEYLAELFLLCIYNLTEDLVLAEI